MFGCSGGSITGERGVHMRHGVNSSKRAAAAGVRWRWVHSAELGV